MAESVALQGGVDTFRERALLHAEFSVLQNIRQRHPGIEQRAGQIRQHSAEDATLETSTLFGFSKAHQSELHFFRQLSDGSLQEASNHPPATTVGVFGPDVLPAVTGSLPASYGVINDRLIYADGVRQHQIYAGTTEPVSTFIVYKDTVAIPAIPMNGEDYTLEVTDGQSDTVAVLDSLSTLALFNTMYVRTSVPMQALNYTVTLPNGTAAVLQAEYWQGSWAAVSGFADGTTSGGASMAQSGAVTWTAPTDELPHYQFGQSGFWYRISLASGAMDAEVEVSEVTFDGAWQNIHNVWDGVLVDAIEAQVYDDSKNQTGDEGYSTYGSQFVSLARMATADYCYFSAIDRLSGIYLDVGNTPNIVKAVVVGSTDISFFASGSTAVNDWVQSAKANFLAAGFEEGQSFAVTGTSSNNGTYTIISVTSSIIRVKPGSLTTEADKSATLTYNNSPVALDLLEVWTGDAWTTVGASLVDATVGLTKSGFVTWDRTATVPQRTQFKQTRHKSYWYRMSFSKSLSNKTNIAIQTMPYFKISDLGLGRTNGVWKGRGLYTFDKFPRDVHVTSTGGAMVLNGTDFTILEPGDGRSNATLATRKFHNELLVWQKEIGEEGGCTTLFEGFDPATFGKLIISNRVGIMNAKCAAVVDGVKTSSETPDVIFAGNQRQTQAFWLSRYGVFMAEGNAAQAISDDVRNFFDPLNANSIRRGYEDKMWLEYDSAENVILVGLVTGSSATVPNTFLAYDLTDRTWSKDTRGQSLSCMTEIDAGSGDIPVIQMGGGAEDGFVYRLNTTDDDVATAINPEYVFEIDGKGKKIQLDWFVLRARALAEAGLTVSIARNGSTEYEKLTGAPLALAPTDIGRKNTYVRHSVAGGKAQSDHLSIKVSNNEVGKRPYILDMGADITVVPANAA